MVCNFARRILGAFLLVILGADIAAAQTGTSTLRVSITDAQAKPVPGATVTITNVATNASRSMKSTAEGEYVFDLLPPRDYRLEVDAKGFSKSVFDNARALIGKQTEGNV